MSGIEGFAVFLFLLNFFCVQLYSFFIESKLKNDNKRILNVKIRVSIYRYISSFIYCGCALCMVACESLRTIRYPVNVDYRCLVVGLILCVTVFAVNFCRVVFTYHKKYIVFQDNKMYYHNGFKEICIDNIESVRRIRIGWRSFYWYLVIKNDKNKRLLINVLLFDKPDMIYKTVENIKCIV